jgi:hypothetical protein
MNEIPKVTAAPTPIKPVAVSALVTGQQKGGNDLPPAVEAAKKTTFECERNASEC